MNDTGHQPLQDKCLINLLGRWDRYATRQQEEDAAWVHDLDEYLAQVAALRLQHVEVWLTANMGRFMTDATVVDTIHRSFEATAVSLKVGVQLCKLSCADCQLLCLLGRHHDGPHSCRTDHHCSHSCQFVDAHGGSSENCGLP